MNVFISYGSANPGAAAMVTEQIDREAKVARDLIAKGKLIEAGWASVRETYCDAGPAQLEELRGAFFAGAAHLFSSILNAEDPGDDATDDDVRRMKLIHAELKAYALRLRALRRPPKGNA